MYIVEIDETASTGTWSKNTLNVTSGVTKQIYLKSNSTDTTFDFKMIDNKDNIVYDTYEIGESATNILNKFVEIPMVGVYTLTVYNSSADETFTGRIIVGRR